MFRVCMFWRQVSIVGGGDTGGNSCCEPPQPRFENKNEVSSAKEQLIFFRQDVDLRGQVVRCMEVLDNEFSAMQKHYHHCGNNLENVQELNRNVKVMLVQIHELIGREYLSSRNGGFVIADELEFMNQVVCLVSKIDLHMSLYETEKKNDMSFSSCMAHDGGVESDCENEKNENDEVIEGDSGDNHYIDVKEKEEDEDDVENRLNDTILEWEKSNEMKNIEEEDEVQYNSSDNMNETVQEAEEENLHVILHELISTLGQLNQPINHDILDSLWHQLPEIEGVHYPTRLDCVDPFERQSNMLCIMTKLYEGVSNYAMKSHKSISSIYEDGDCLRHIMNDMKSTTPSNSRKNGGECMDISKSMMSTTSSMVGLASHLDFLLRPNES